MHNYYNYYNNNNYNYYVISSHEGYKSPSPATCMPQVDFHAAIPLDEHALICPSQGSILLIVLVAPSQLKWKYTTQCSTLNFHAGSLMYCIVSFISISAV